MLEGWRNFKLTDEEKSALLQAQPILEEICSREKLSLLKLVVTERVVNNEALRSTMLVVWKLIGKADFKEVGHNLFLIEFFETLNIQKIQEGRS